MIITYHREKLLNAIIYMANNTMFCGKTKLLKLLYFLDFKHFKQTAKSVTGLDYYAWEKGPVPKKLFEELSGNMKPDMRESIQNIIISESFQKITAKKKFDDQYFSKREMRLLGEIAYIFKDAKANDMVESTHLFNEPWEKTKNEKGLFSPIDYMLAVDSDIYSLSYNEAKERMTERQEMFDIFGAK
jgi:uncharacterized phage-associated protein